jgi:hypothetical protein
MPAHLQIVAQTQSTRSSCHKIENSNTDFFVRNCRISHLNILDCLLIRILTSICCRRDLRPRRRRPVTNINCWRIRVMKSDVLGCVCAALLGAAIVVATPAIARVAGSVVAATLVVSAPGLLAAAWH